MQEGDETQIFQNGPKQSAVTTISNPNCFWSNNGIAYEVNVPSNFAPTQQRLYPGNKAGVGSASVSREKIRRKLDVLLYNVSRRVKYIFSQNFDKTSYEFADALSNEVITLSAYLQEHKSRILINQFVEVCLEPLMMMKKALIEIALHSNILVLDFTKNLGFHELLISAKGPEATVDGNSPQNKNEI